MQQECIICLDKDLTDNYNYDSDTFIKNCSCKIIAHTECLKQWLSVSPICPLCREPFYIRSNSLPNNRDSEPVIDFDINITVQPPIENINNNIELHDNIQVQITLIKYRIYCIALIALIIIVIYNSY